MQKAVVYYRSRKGTTKYFAEEIGEFLNNKNLRTEVFSVFDFKPEQVQDANYVLFGCWTHGLFFVLQHPDSEWVKFANELPSLDGKKIGLFTTYKIATGSMFRKMQKQLDGKIGQVGLTIKAKSEKLLDEHKKQLEDFIG